MDKETIDAKTESDSSTGSSDDAEIKLPDSSAGDKAKVQESFDDGLASLVKKTFKKSSVENGEASESLSEEDKEVEESDDTDEGEKEDPEKESKEESEEKEEEGTDEGEDGEKEKKAEPDDSKLPFHEHPRWKEVISERNTLKKTVEEQKPAVEFGQAIGEFCMKNQLSQDDLNTALEVAALLRANPEKGREKLQTYLDAVDVVLGNRLPADLQKRLDSAKKRLDDGLIDEDTYKEYQENLVEVSKARISSKQGELRSKTSVEEQNAKTQRENLSAINAWEESARKRDPDYSKKEKMLLSHAQKLFSAKPPQSSREVAALLDEAYNEVNEFLRGFRSNGQQKRTVLTSSRSSREKGKEVVLAADMSNLDKIVRTAASMSR